MAGHWDDRTAPAADPKASAPAQCRPRLKPMPAADDEQPMHLRRAAERQADQQNTDQQEAESAATGEDENRPGLAMARRQSGRRIVAQDRQRKLRRQHHEHYREKQKRGCGDVQECETAIPCRARVASAPGCLFSAAKRRASSARARMEAIASDVTGRRPTPRRK